METAWGFEEGDEIAPGLFATTLLGGGSKHEAYLAWDDRLFALVVVKVLRPHVANDASARRQIAGEAGALAALQHPVLPRCFGASSDGDRPHVVLEFLEGPRLSTLIRKQGALAMEQALPLDPTLLGTPLLGARGLGAPRREAEERGDGRAAPADRPEHRGTGRPGGRSWPPIGTDAYMAPEQCGVSDAGRIVPRRISGASESPSTKASRAVSRLRGTGGYVRSGSIPQLVHDPAPLPKDVPESLADPIMWCLARRPGERPTAAALAERLEPLVAVLPKPSIVPRTRPRRRSHR